MYDGTSFWNRLGDDDFGGWGRRGFLLGATSERDRGGQRDEAHRGETELEGGLWGIACSQLPDNGR
jgi:hypothetical protein